MNEVHFSSKSNEWETPKEVFDTLNEEFNFTLDPCCTMKTAKCEKFYTISENGLEQDWSKDTVFVNPPYGREISDWVKKSYEEYLKGATVVMLIPARTDTKYYHDYIFNKAEIRFLKGRIKFLQNGEIGQSAPFPSAIIVFSKNNNIIKNKGDIKWIKQ